MSGSARTLASRSFVGGDPSLDFVNTVNSRVAPERDDLRSFEDLLAWAERAGTLGSADRGRLRQVAAADVARAARVLRAARRRREAAYRVFSAVAAGRVPPERDVRLLLRAHADALGHARLEMRDGGFRPVWPVGSDPWAVLRPIDHAAGRLLLSPEVGLVKECPGCGWVFLDRSRNHSRRWCDMQVCGTRDKMRRYRRGRGDEGSRSK